MLHKLIFLKLIFWSTKNDIGDQVSDSLILKMMDNKENLNGLQYLSL